MDIIEAWLADLGRVLDGESPTVTDVRIGVFYTGAQLATGETGLAFTPRDLADTVCCPRSAAAAPQSGRLARQEAWALAREALSPVVLRRAVGIAVLNALSARAMARSGVPGGRVLAGVDALEAAEVGPEDRVAMVGACVGAVALVCVVPVFWRGVAWQAPVAFVLMPLPGLSLFLAVHFAVTYL